MRTCTEYVSNENILRKMRMVKWYGHVTRGNMIALQAKEKNE